MEQLLLRGAKVLVSGQLKTSRTEDLESYLKSRAAQLAVFGFMSPFSSSNQARCSLYEDTEEVRRFRLPHFKAKIGGRVVQPLMAFSFLLASASFFISVLRLRRRFDLFIGIATFSTILGMLLKKMGLVKKVVYYCLDYYPKPVSPGFNRFLNLLFRKADAWLIRQADILWSISPRIREGRRAYAGVDTPDDKEVIVPLGYRNGIERDLPLGEREPFSLGFVGTLSENQGLDLVVEGVKELKKEFPAIKVHIIGDGPYAKEFRAKVLSLSLDKHFVFYGFVPEDEKVYNVLSRCLAGLAVWTGDENDNSVYADPGKPKLYALLGLPVIITSAPYVVKVIAETGAGEVIDYRVSDFVNAAKKIFSVSNFESYRQGVNRFRPHCLAKKAFDEAFNIR